MRPSQQFGTLTRRALLCLMALSFAAPVFGQSSRVISVEEHWELSLAQPDADRSAPQITMVFSPDGDLDGVHFLFTLNHGSVPQYEPGGMQVQLWDDDQLVDSATAETGALASDEEVVRWRQRSSLEDGALKFEVLEGESETWGQFGGESLTVSLPTMLYSLNAYRPAMSLTESQVNYAENRVVSLTLTKLVWVTDDGQVHEMSAPIAVDTSLDQ